MANRSTLTLAMQSRIARRYVAAAPQSAPKPKDKRKCCICQHVIGSHALRKRDLFCSACRTSCVGEVATR